jgi:hypothetical protein
LTLYDNVLGMFDSSTCELVEIAIQCSSFRLFFCSVCHNMCTLLVPTFWHCKCLHVQRYFDFTHISVCMCRHRVTMFARWKLRGMYATCMWLVQLLLMLSKQDPLFSYVPEFYVETLVDSFHALRRSDPPFVSPSSLLQQGLSPFVRPYYLWGFSFVIMFLSLVT